MFRSLIVGLILVSLTASTADARWGWRFRRAFRRPSVNRTVSRSYIGSWNAQQKAAYMARNRLSGHPGGLVASYEGSGRGSTAAQALANCCNPGVGWVCTQSGVAWNGGTAYAVKGYERVR